MPNGNHCEDSVPEVTKIFFILNSVEHEIHIAQFESFESLRVLFIDQNPYPGYKSKHINK